MAANRLSILACAAALSSSIALGEGGGSVTGTGNRVDVAERNVKQISRDSASASRASVPALTRELRDLELESSKQSGQQARRNDVRIRALQRELSTLGAEARKPDTARAERRYRRRTRLITPEIPVVDLDAEWRALQEASQTAPD